MTLLVALATVAAYAQLTDWQNISSKNFVMKIIHDENFLYLGTKGGGIVKMDKQSGKQTVLKRADGSMTGNSITDMTLHDGDLWVGTEYNGLARVNDSGIEKFDMKNAGFLNNQNFSGIYFNADRTMLVGSIAFLYAFDGRKCTAEYDINLLSPYAYVKKNSSLPEANIMDLTFDANGNLWLMGDRFITKFDGTSFMGYPYELNVANDYLLTIDADNDNVYVGSRFEGLLKLADKGLTVIPLTDNLLYDNTMSLSSGCLDEEGNFYVGSLYGLQKYNIDTGGYQFEPMSQTAQTETDRNGNVWLLWPWFSTDTCLVEITATGKKAYMRTDYPFNEADANLVKFDRNNRLWIATNKGLYMCDGETWTVYNKSNSSLSETVQCMAFDSNNRLWCGTFGSGLFCFDGTRWNNYTTSNSSLPSNYVGAIAVDNNNVVWLNCRDNQYPDKYGVEYGFGLTLFDGNTWTTYSRNNSPLPSDCFYDVQVDADNRLWIATAGDVGLVCYDETEWTISDTDNSGIALNEVTKITLDPKRDLIWLTHYPGLGLSVARMNCKTSSIHPVRPSKPADLYYDLQGRRVSRSTHGFYISNGNKIVK